MLSSIIPCFSLFRGGECYPTMHYAEHKEENKSKVEKVREMLIINVLVSCG